MEGTIQAKWFSELTTSELYEILRSRSEIFVVEQNCVYQDIDGKDDQSLHVFCMEDGRVGACLRAFVKDEETVQMGRVLSLKHGQGYGGAILRAGIREIRQRMHPGKIVIEAQCYAAGYYEREGFRICSEPFLEDGIPHVQMVLDFGKEQDRAWSPVNGGEEIC